MNKELTNYVVIFQTGKILEIDLTVDLLKEAGIPYYTREDTSGGLRLAMPATPAMGPGTWWSLLIPERYIPQAEQALSQLPFDIKINAGVWDFGPTKKVKIGFRIYIWIVLLLSFVILIYKLIDILI